MPRPAYVTAFADALSAPAIRPVADLQTDLAVASGAAATAAQQVAAWDSALTSVEFQTTDPDVAAKCIQLRQQIGAMQRNTAELQRAARDSSLALRLWAELGAELVALVPDTEPEE